MTKKKYLTAISVAVLLIVVLAMVFSGCTKNVYQKMNDVLKKSHENITIEIVTKQDGETLKSLFIIKNDNKTTINYTVEQFAEIGSTIPSKDKRVSVGKAVVENGKVTQQSGNALENVDFTKMSKVELRFEKEMFGNVQDVDGVFTADVTNPSAFMPTVDCSKMSVEFSYASTVQNVLQIFYTANNGAEVSITYTIS